MPLPTNIQKPHGVVKPVRVVCTRTSPHAVYVTIICVDEVGVEWSFDATTFNFGLKRLEQGYDQARTANPLEA